MKSAVRKTISCAALAAIASFGAEPWDRPFAGDARAILDAAKRVPAAEQGVSMLLFEQRFVVHANGSVDATYRQVYRVDQQSEVDDWSSL